MIIYTIGFTQKSAELFFKLIKKNHIEILLDIRLNNKSQLAGFTKGDDLKYFLSEICNCQYNHCIEYAPTKEILDSYKNKSISWHEYEKKYSELMNTRGNYNNFDDAYKQYNNVCLLCSEPISTNCHRRLLAEIITAKFPQLKIEHL